MKNSSSHRESNWLEPPVFYTTELMTTGVDSNSSHIYNPLMCCCHGTVPPVQYMQRIVGVGEGCLVVSEGRSGRSMKLTLFMLKNSS